MSPGASTQTTSGFLPPLRGPGAILFLAKGPCVVPHIHPLGHT